MGIPSHATVASAKANHRRMRHRIDNYHQTEDEIGKVIIKEDEDIPLWRGSNDKYKENFCTKVTKNLVRISHPCQ